MDYGITEQDVAAAEELGLFVRKSPSPFHAVATLRAHLDDAGFCFLPEGAAWRLEPGGAYYTVRNNSSLVAFRAGADLNSAGHHFQITASHSDSPSFKIKSVAGVEGPGAYVRLNTEAYGGMIDSTWFDRPLSAAGRVMVRDGARIESRLFESGREILLIPSLAVHLNREANAGFSPNRQVDLLPLFSAGELGADGFDEYVAAELGVDRGAVVARDLFLVNSQDPGVWGAGCEFFSAPRLDDLACAFVSLKAFLAARNDRAVSVFCCFDNEEVGSNTKQGAMSTFLRDALSRISAALGASDEEHLRALAASMLVSCDNAHAVHPAHPEKHDAGNRAYLNRGIVVKEAANQRYCTDAFSRAVFEAICDDAGVPYQAFANRSDMAGGSTLGNLSNIQVSLHAVDVGLPQLAMHSAYETMGARDVLLGIAALTAFYEADIRIEGADSVTLA